MKQYFKLIFIFLFSILSMPALCQEITLTQQIKAKQCLTNFNQFLSDYCNGKAESRILLEDLMETRSNKVCNDLSDDEMIEFNEYLNLILQQKPTISFSEIPPKEQWQVAYNKINDQQYLVIKISKTVNETSKTNYFFINPINNKVVNIYKTLPGLLTYSKLKDAPQPKTKITEDSIVKYGSIELITEVSGKFYIDDVYQKDIVKDLKYTMPEIILGIHSLKIEGENETWQESVTVKDGIKTSIIAKALKKDNGNETVTDYDGNVYKTVTIGTQVWMAENLKATHYRDGTAIPNVTDNTAWNNLTTGAYCNYNNTATNATTYGKLYNYYAVETDKLCPAGWRVPSDEDWKTLEIFLGMSSNEVNKDEWRGIIGSKLKESGTSHWNSPNNATDSSGFTALPGGERDGNGPFFYIGSSGFWWTSTEYKIDPKYAFLRIVAYDTNVNRGSSHKAYGYSVRCIKD